MTIAPVCPRCGGRLAAPDLFSSSWRCARDADVDPLYVVAPIAVDSLDHLVARSAAVPVWVFEPAPVAWTIGGLAYAGDERTGPRATVTAWSGPAPAGGVADLLLVAEEPGVGLGARYAGYRGVDAGECVVGPPSARVRVHHRPVALWECRDTVGEQAAYVGEAAGYWLWVVVWPGLADLLLLEELALRDARSEPCRPQIGATCTRLFG